MFKHLVLAACGVIALSATSATAQQRWPNWYLGIHADMAFIPDQGADVNGSDFGDFDYDQGWGAGASIGYMPGGSTILNGFRFELEYSHIGADVGTAAGFPIGGDVGVNTFMANAFYDFNLGGFIPYIGGGAGVANVQFDGDGSSIDDSDNAFAWQAMAGVGYAPQLAPNTVLTLGYRYLSTSDLNYGDNVTDIETDFDAHNVQLGARFNF